jgi:formamidopyrimidine-DNA glycosylase
MQGLRRHLPGRKVIGVAAGNKKLRKPMPRKYLKKYLQGVRFESVNRRAKFLLLTMDNSATLVIHLGMSGRLGVFAGDSPRAKHDHLRLLLDNGMELRFNDIRRFGFVQVVAPGRDPGEALPAGLGPEPLGPDFTPRYMLKKAVNRKRPLKNFLMENRVVVGIGNIYACETLFHAGITPERNAGDLSAAEWTRVVESSRCVLQQAIGSGGTSISDFVNESGRTGYFQLQLKVYGREGKPCLACATPIVRKTMAGRATFFCPRCQK